jgi:hypothetical protein
VSLKISRISAKSAGATRIPCRAENDGGFSRAHQRNNRLAVSALSHLWPVLNGDLICKFRVAPAMQFARVHLLIKMGEAKASP